MVNFTLLAIESLYHPACSYLVMEFANTFPELVHFMQGIDLPPKPFSEELSASALDRNSPFCARTSILTANQLADLEP